MNAKKMQTLQFLSGHCYKDLGLEYSLLAGPPFLTPPPDIFVLHLLSFILPWDVFDVIG